MKLQQPMNFHRPEAITLGSFSRLFSETRDPFGLKLAAAHAEPLGCAQPDERH